jgi:hypothetical protein
MPIMITPSVSMSLVCSLYMDMGNDMVGFESCLGLFYEEFVSPLVILVTD